MTKPQDFFFFFNFFLVTSIKNTNHLLVHNILTHLLFRPLIMEGDREVIMGLRLGWRSAPPMSEGAGDGTPFLA